MALPIPHLWKAAVSGRDLADAILEGRQQRLAQHSDDDHAHGGRQHIIQVTQPNGPSLVYLQQWRDVAGVSWLLDP